MTRLRLFAAVFVAFPVALLAGGIQRPDVSAQEIRLCSALESVLDGQRLMVVVSGIYAIGFEHQVFYDPAEPECATDIQPASWVEFAPGAKVPPELSTLLAQSKRAFVTFRGELVGPALLGADDQALPLVAAFANRFGARRYGHLSGFRTKLVVNEVLAALAVPSDMENRVALSRPTASLNLDVERGEVPRYPALARRAGLRGTVVLEVTVIEGEVGAAVVKSGDRMLAEAAVSNVMTWHFKPGTNGSFTTTFFYQLERRKAGSDQLPVIELRLPEFVRITAPTFDW